MKLKNRIPVADALAVSRIAEPSVGALPLEDLDLVLNRRAALARWEPGQRGCADDQAQILGKRGEHVGQEFLKGVRAGLSFEEGRNGEDDVHVTARSFMPTRTEAPPANRAPRVPDAASSKRGSASGSLQFHRHCVRKNP